MLNNPARKFYSQTTINTEYATLLLSSQNLIIQESNEFTFSVQTFFYEYISFVLRFFLLVYPSKLQNFSEKNLESFLKFSSQQCSRKQKRYRSYSLKVIFLVKTNEKICYF